MKKAQISVKDIVRITKGTLLSDLKDSVLEEFLIDSRQLGIGSKTLFFAIKTDKNNGHNYINTLFEKGVRNFIVTEDFISDEVKSSSNVILVDNAVVALQSIASFYRSTLTYPIIGITGSNGKTIVKEWLSQLLSSVIDVSRSPKSYNSQLGVALSILGLPPDSQLGIIEAGISQIGEMEILEKIIRPNIGIITNIGKAHSQNFDNQLQLIQEKIKLFVHSDTILYCSDYHDIDQELHKCYPDKQLISWSRNEMSETMKNEIDYFHNPAAIENISHCLKFIEHFNIRINDVDTKLSEISPLEMRLETKDGINNCLIINDSYSLDIDSFKIAIGELMRQPRFALKSVIVSDFLQSDMNDDTLYHTVSEIINNQDINIVVLIGAKITLFKNLFKAKVYCYSDTEDYLKRFNSAMFINQAILLKGARSFQFEKIGKRLQRKEHETVLDINVDAILSNLSIIRNKLKPQTKLLVMVKAFSYGSGSVEIASILQSQKVDYLAVAFVDEGIELREAGINLPIIVMNPEISALSAMIKFHLEPEVYSINKLETICSLVKMLGYNNINPLKIHIKLDTGMHRLGFMNEDFPLLLNTLQDNKDFVTVSSIFSHLACADMPERDDFTMKQISLFTKMTDEIEHKLGYKIDKHILNSYGIARFTDYQFDMVRLGIGLYGAEEKLNHIMNLQSALSLHAKVSYVRRVPKGDGVGYGQTWTAEQDSEIAILPIGYADGFRLSLSNSYFKVFIDSHYVPIVGRVCMDMCFADVTGLGIHEGDNVEIFGEHVSLANLAEAANTIPYEIISTLSQRIKRVYYQ